MHHHNNCIILKLLFLSLYIAMLENTNHGVFNIYWDCEEKCQQLTGRISRYIHGEQAMYVVAVGSSIYSILTGNFDTSTWMSTYNLVLPFATQTVWAWYARLIIQLNMGFSYASSVVPTTAFFQCCCTYINAMCDHFRLLIHSTEENVEQMQSMKNPPKYNELRVEVEKTVCRLIEIHTKVFE